MHWNDYNFLKYTWIHHWCLAVMLRKILLFKAVRSECVEECVFLSHSIWTRFHAHPPLHRVYPYSPRSFWFCPVVIHIIMCFCSTDSLNLCRFPSFSLFFTPPPPPSLFISLSLSLSLSRISLMDLFFHWKDESEVILKWGQMKSESTCFQKSIEILHLVKGRLRKCSIMERDGGSVASLLN